MSSTVSMSDTPLYLRGFLVSCGHAVRAPANFHSIDHDDLSILVEERAHTAHAKDGGCEVLVMGVIIDTAHPDSSPEDIAKGLLACLHTSRDLFYRSLYALGGRYAILARDADGYFVTGDAGGVRSIFYTLPDSGFMACSHAALLARQVGAPVVGFAKNIQEFGQEKYRARNWPGRLSKYEGVYQLTANTSLNLSNLSVNRFFPFEELPNRSSKEAAEIASTHIKNAADALMKHYVSDHNGSALLLLTSGIDSRLTLSAMKDHADRLSTLTYRVSSANDGDMKVAEQLASMVGVEHLSFVAHKQPLPSVTEWGEENSACVYLGNRSVIETCARELGRYGFSLRGNLGEISRGVFLARRAFMDSPVKFMARVWYRGSEKHQYILDVFDDYARTVEIDKARWPLRVLYYWEHRHATWHAATANVMDCAFDTFNVMNSRAIIEAMCGVSEEEQVSGSVHREVINILWPELMSLPINPHGKS